VLWPQRIAIIDCFADAMPADSVGAARAGGGEHLDPAHCSQLDNEPARGSSTSSISTSPPSVRIPAASMVTVTRPASRKSLWCLLRSRLSALPCSLHPFFQYWGKFGLFGDQQIPDPIDRGMWRYSVA
jgi:hypothetical protein